MDKLLKNKDEIRDSFNKIVSIICTHLGNKFPNTDFGQYRNTINSYITEFPYEPISVFIKYIYSNDIYREKILNGDETFFINQTYENDNSAKIFMIKNIWVEMDISNKNFIKSTFKNLIERCDVYIDILWSINKLKKI